MGMVGGRGMGRGQGRGQQYRPGPGGICVCTQCGYEAPHQRGTPCTDQKCPRCGMLMVRKDMVPNDVGPPMT